MIWTMLILFPQTSTLLTRKLCCISLKTTKQWSRGSLKEEVPQWDMFPEPTELLLIGCSIESIWTHQKPTRRQLTKGNFTCDEWHHLLCLFNNSHFRSINSLEAMSKRTQEDASEGRVTAKSQPMMNLVSRCSVRDPNVLASTAPESSGDTSGLVEWAANRYGETRNGG